MAEGGRRGVGGLGGGGGCEGMGLRGGGSAEGKGRICFTFVLASIDRPSVETEIIYNEEESQRV